MRNIALQLLALFITFNYNNNNKFKREMERRYGTGSEC